MFNILLFAFIVFLLTLCLHKAHFLFNKQQTAGRDFTTMLKGVAIIIIMMSHITGQWGRVFTPLGGTHSCR